jgi:hypothetical protein
MCLERAAIVDLMIGIALISTEFAIESSKWFVDDNSIAFIKTASIKQLGVDIPLISEQFEKQQ